MKTIPVRIKYLLRGFAVIVLTHLMVGCYTVLSHPDVEYTREDLDIPDSLTYIHLEGLTVPVDFAEKCSGCHSDYSVREYYLNKQLYLNDTGGEDNADVYFYFHKPWWRDVEWNTEDEIYLGKGEDIQKSRRSYRRGSTAASSGGGFLESPSLIGGGQSGTAAPSSGSAKAPTLDPNLPVRQKDAPDKLKTDSTEENGSDNTTDDNSGTEKTKRRRR